MTLFKLEISEDTRLDSEKQGADLGAKKKNMKKKKIWKKIITVLVVVLLIGGAVYACMPKGAAGMGTSVYKNDVYTAARGDVYDTISATGLIESSEDTTAKVHSTLTYKIGTVNVALGDKVNAGDVLCVYDTETLERQIRERELSMTTSERSAALNLANAKLTYESCLAGMNAGTNASLVSAESSYASAAEALERAQDDYDKYAAKLADSAVITLNQAKRNLDEAQKNYEEARRQQQFPAGGQSKERRPCRAQAQRPGAAPLHGRGREDQEESPMTASDPIHTPERTATGGHMLVQHRVVFSLGSNLGDRLDNIQEAVDALFDAPGLTFVALSPVYETSPYAPPGVSIPEQGDFLNIVLVADTRLSTALVVLFTGFQPVSEWGRSDLLRKMLQASQQLQLVDPAPKREPAVPTP